MIKNVSLASLSLILSFAVQGQPLPPVIPWDGQSKQFVRAVDDAWITPAEEVNFSETPDYEATISWLRKLVRSSSHLTMHTIGKSNRGLHLWLIVASSQGADSPEDLNHDRPTVLVHAGIHSGEIDGKDAGMMLFRDIVQHDVGLLDSLNILFIPVLNPDGHEMRSAYSRVNQRGPDQAGWRTNARNLNLNRDFAKAETPEIQAFLKVLNQWPTDLYIDLHVTDGIDYQHDITFGWNSNNTHSPNLSRWLDDELKPQVYRALKNSGHTPGPLLFAVDNRNPSAGLLDWTATPRFSNGYGDVRHLPSILVENHSLKPYDQRVLGTYVFLHAVFKKMATSGLKLRQASAKDQARRPQNIPMGWQWDFTNAPEDTFEILGIDYEYYDSPVSGRQEIRWLGKPRNYGLPNYKQSPNHLVSRPKAYWIPVAYSGIINKLKLHGIELDIIDEPHTVDVELYRLISPKLAKTAFEGRVQLNPGKLSSERRQQSYLPGSAKVSTDQPLGDLAILLLEPHSEDSFLQWGFFHEILQRTEYIEGYVVEPLARQMLEAEPDLKLAFEEALQDSSFANDPQARLRWFYNRSPYYDPQHMLYPIGREL